MTQTTSSRRTPAPRATPGKKNRKAARAGAAGANPPTPKKLLAFEVSEDFEGRAEIVWARSTAAARREVMGELNAEFNQLSTKRIPELDGFKGDIDQYKFDHGWWSTCNYQPCHKERCGKDGAVYRDGIWACCDEHVTLEQERRTKEKVRKAEVTTEALRIKPGSTVHDVHLNPDGEAWIWMTFPSGVTRSHTSLEWLAGEEGQKA